MRSGNGLVAAQQRNDAVEHWPRRTSSIESAIRFAADQRGLHALGAHSYTVADGDGVEFHGRTAGCAYPFLDLRGQTRAGCKLHGMVSIQVLATPMMGFARSLSVNPMALSMARAGA